MSGCAHQGPGKQAKASKRQEQGEQTIGRNDWNVVALDSTERGQRGQ